MVEWGFSHVTTSPYHSEDSGLIEKSIKSQLLNRSVADGKYRWLSSLEVSTSAEVKQKVDSNVLHVGSDVHVWLNSIMYCETNNYSYPGHVLTVRCHKALHDP